MNSVTRWAALTAVLILGGAAPALAASCTTAGTASAKAIPMGDPKASGELLANTGLWLVLAKEKSFAPELARLKDSCERTRFGTSRGTYVLRGDNGDYAILRLAAPETKGAPELSIVPIVNLTAALKAGAKGPAPIAAYGLVSAVKDVHTVWRLYDAVPDDALLTADMTAAVAETIRPLLVIEGKNIRIIVPES
jgi:hypothetical protein